MAADPETSATGTPDLDPQGVPVVDLTTLLFRLHQDAHRMRVTAHTLRTEAGAMEQQADHLDDLITVLAGGQT